MAGAVAAARLADPKHSSLFFFFFFPHALPVGENMEFGGGVGVVFFLWGPVPG